MKTTFAGALFLLFLLALPSGAHAANATFFGPIVPAECHCDNQMNPVTGAKDLTTAPDYGCVLQVIQNSINFAVSMGIILFVLYLTYAGLILVTSGGSPGALQKGKTRLFNVIVGMAVLLCAWLIVDFVMKTLYNEGPEFGPWNAILASKSATDRCVVAKKPTALFSGSVTLNTITPGTGGGVSAVGGGVGTTKMNTAAAASYALSHASASSGNRCAYAVRLALAAGGLKQFDNDHPASAYQYGPYLIKAGFKQVGGGTYSPSIEGGITGLQAGDVVVFQKAPGHDDGHIAIYTGSQWVSDYKQNTMSSNPNDYNGTSYVIYRP